MAKRENTEDCYGYNESACCGAVFHEPDYPDNDICSDCKEHTTSMCTDCEDICEDYKSED